MIDFLDIVYYAFNGEQGIEIEDSEGKPVKIGTWVQREDGMWVLRVTRKEFKMEVSDD